MDAVPTARRIFSFFVRVLHSSTRLTPVIRSHSIMNSNAKEWINLVGEGLN